MVVERGPVEMLMLRDRLYNWDMEKKRRFTYGAGKKGNIDGEKRDIKNN